MKKLEERIQRDGKVKKGDILKVDSFLNHQIDIGLVAEMGEEFARLFADDGVNKIITIEASGIAIAAEAARVMGVPLVFVKKSKTSNLADDLYTSKVMSYTHGVENTIVVSKDYLKASDRVLIIDDFLATGSALTGLIDLVRQAGAHLCGCGIAIEKGFQPGGRELREKGIKVESLAIIENMDADTGIIEFRH